MTRTITRTFDSHSDAVAAVAELERLGVPTSSISIIANNRDRAHGDRDYVNQSEAAEDAGKGASAGALLGGAGGLLAGLGVLAIPGLGPVVAAGWLASTLAGAGVGALLGGAAGGLVGALKNEGVDEDDAHVYAESVRRGGTLVSAKVDDDLAPRAEEVLQNNRAVRAADRRLAYQEDGWTRFDENAPEYTDDDIARERARYTSQSTPL
jgi:hypothetical protein